ncbi:adenine deaminase [Pseudobacteriovorax antillogorgiicola]|uniref:Adenine deaminase n=1 Tax=Pseudobacteriovorax antillogorgiicola TaxID=1513793 RepID=A0A1Y6CA68_9BACT|nr:adenine deaminase [Pseudobacteriovorax antillogorgiicola]TCS49773.1 adenine deaminase [Pseudobacteriovorax antillogorgiicola]SMF42762.1 Adenine deaminase [Pseudobacteriovorax antillogorgiicola]
MTSKARYISIATLRSKIKAARGEIKADIVIKNAHYLDVYSGKFVLGDVAMFEGAIVGIDEPYEGQHVIDGTGQYLVPGFIDSHVHIESSLMTPARFQQVTMPCGTTTAIWDPHEIANVKGKDGIRWALDSSAPLEMDIFVMVPSCVPSTSEELGFESNGFALHAEDIKEFRDHPRVLGLAEMMNFPGLLHGDEEVLQKLLDYKELKRDGHCPSLSGKDLNAYGVAGIHSCHESTRLEEAQEKLRKGIAVLIREGSCAKDAQTLLPLIDAYTSATVGLCSDDRNPLDIAETGHINCIVDMALRGGMRPEDIFRAASFGAARLYGLDDRGAVAPGLIADLCLVQPRDAQSWASGLQINQVFKAGHPVDEAVLEKVAAGEQVAITGRNINMKQVTKDDLRIESLEDSIVHVIGVIPNQILTQRLEHKVVAKGGELQSNLDQDILKIAVFERHHGTGNQTIGFVQGFGLKEGAIVTSINHDSHNIIAVAASDQAMLKGLEAIKSIDGGIVVVDGQGQWEALPLPLGGLMTHESPDLVADTLKRLKAKARAMGCQLDEPFLQLSFLALPVIPSLKITDRGLVDVDQFEMIPVVKA